MVVQDSKLLKPDGTKAWDVFANNLSNNYIASKLLVDLQKWRNMFCTEIGIPNANTEKKERMLTDEVNANNVETESWAASALELLQDGCKKVNDMFGVGISVDWRFDNAGSNTFDSGLV